METMRAVANLAVGYMLRSYNTGASNHLDRRTQVIQHWLQASEPDAMDSESDASSLDSESDDMDQVAAEPPGRSVTARLVAMRELRNERRVQRARDPAAQETAFAAGHIAVRTLHVRMMPCT
jgi:hypothetical protein